MGSAPTRYGPDGAVAWGEMWGSFCALALDGGPPRRGTLLRAPRGADPASRAYRAVARETVRAVDAVADLRAHASVAPGWVGIACYSPEMAAWLAGAIVEEAVEAYAEGALLL